MKPRPESGLDCLICAIFARQWKGESSHAFSPHPCWVQGCKGAHPHCGANPIVAFRFTLRYCIRPLATLIPSSSQGAGCRVQSARFRVQGAGHRVQSSGCKVQGAGYRVQGVGFRVQGSGFRVQGSGFRVQGSGFRVQGLGFGVQGSGLRVQGSGFRVQGPGFWVQGAGFRPTPAVNPALPHRSSSFCNPHPSIRGSRGRCRTPWHIQDIQGQILALAFRQKS